ncbi:MAG: hypothetical protein ACI4MI_03985 [Christensenellales bacterium]
MTHKLEIVCNRFKPLKIVLLAACLLVDFCNLWIFFAGIVAANIWEILKSLLIFAILLVVRFAACALIYGWKYCFDDKKLQVEKYGGIIRKKYSFDYDKIDELKKIDRCDSKDKSTKFVCKGCNYDLFEMIYDGKRYVIALDEYAYCLIKGKVYDIS